MMTDVGIGPYEPVMVGARGLKEEATSVHYTL